MNRLILYIHGKGGSAAEAGHYRPLFPGCVVLGLDYQSDTPWAAKTELRAAVEALRGAYGHVTLIANSIGAYYSMCAGLDALIDRAFFLSPIVDMERLILDMLAWAGTTEAELEARGTIPTAFGETLSRDYLCWVRANPVRWTAPTAILYGGKDHLAAYETVEAFARAHNASLTVMPDGEHWFHTPEQLQFLDAWLRSEA